MKSLHDKIMSMNQRKMPYEFSVSESVAYNVGEHDARCNAAELAKEYDAIIEELVESFQRLLASHKDFMWAAENNTIPDLDWSKEIEEQAENCIAKAKGEN